MSRYHYDEDRPKENFPIGDVALKLDALKLSSDAQKMTFKLVNPTNGQTEGEVQYSRVVCFIFKTFLNSLICHAGYLKLAVAHGEGGAGGDGGDGVRVPGVGRALRLGRHGTPRQVHYSSPCHYITAPSVFKHSITCSFRWSTADGKTFTDELEQAGSKVPEGWEVSSTWSIMSTSFDPDGWQYATRLDSANWYPENNNALCKPNRIPSMSTISVAYLSVVCLFSQS